LALSVLPVSRRENLIVSYLRSTLQEDADAMRNAAVEDIVTWSLENLDLYSTELVANTLLDLRDHIVCRRFWNLVSLCSAIDREGAKVDCAHTACRAVVERRQTQQG
jgi:hypothetical protein